MAATAAVAAAAPARLQARSSLCWAHSSSLMANRDGSRLAALLRTASWILSDSGTQLAAGGPFFGAKSALQASVMPRQLHSAALSAPGSVPLCSSTRGIAAGAQAAFAAVPVHNEASERRPHPGAAIVPSSETSRQRRVAQQPPYIRRQRPTPRQQAAQAKWQPESPEDRAAAELADRMNDLVRHGQPQAAMDLFDRNFKVGLAILLRLSTLGSHDMADQHTRQVACCTWKYIDTEDR